ncbi:MAG: DUF998 domain-containing protein [Brevundimonas sp.]
MNSPDASAGSAWCSAFVPQERWRQSDEPSDSNAGVRLCGGDGEKVLPFSGLRTAALILLAIHGLGLLGAGAYPCDFECPRNDPSASQQLHDLFGGVGYLTASPGCLPWR